MSKITTRPLEAEDKPAWRDLWRGYLDYYETTVSDEVYDFTFARLIDPKRPSMNAFLAVSGEQPCGLVHYIFHEHCWKLEEVCYLQDLYVNPGIRGGGVGRALIEAVYDAADRKGTPSVYWMTQEFNYRGRMLYDQVASRTPFIKYQR
ncbi:GNAT family N-acetyltransferase [Henriciella sp.]|uniref:GNAT family N-acetyltransferase n=1 Tax=Henriciella sp. TaxID=1968823 RepID=UPI002616D6AD|nr:GNAT family N-acetyltransferase [Henriciella sp.]